YTMPFYFGLKQNGVLLINHDGPMKLPPQETNELKERNAKLYYIPATQLSLKVAGLDLATNMALMGAIGAITRLTTLEALGEAVKDRFLGKGFVVSGGTAALDSVVERKFKQKQELIEKNIAVIKAGWDYAEEHGWGVEERAEAKKADDLAAAEAASR
ncbi:MAG: ferredoxin oxidoreductase, partial [Nitrospirae bacterium]